MRIVVAVIATAAAAVGSAALVLAAPSSAERPAGSTPWRIIARGDDIGSGAVAAAAKHRTVRLAIRVQVTGHPKIARVWTTLLCSHGPNVDSRRAHFDLRTHVVKVLQPPMPYPENCGVAAYATAITRGAVALEILASP